MLWKSNSSHCSLPYPYLIIDLENWGWKGPHGYFGYFHFIYEKTLTPRDQATSQRAPWWQIQVLILCILTSTSGHLPRPAQPLNAILLPGSCPNTLPHLFLGWLHHGSCQHLEIMVDPTFLLSEHWCHVTQVISTACLLPSWNRQLLGLILNLTSTVCSPAETSTLTYTVCMYTHVHVRTHTHTSMASTQHPNPTTNTRLCWF